MSHVYPNWGNDASIGWSIERIIAKEQARMQRVAERIVDGPFWHTEHQWNPAPRDREAVYAWLGRSWSRHVRRSARKTSVYRAAKNLRKQGIGLQTALILLTR